MDVSKYSTISISHGIRIVLKSGCYGNDCGNSIDKAIAWDSTVYRWVYIAGAEDLTYGRILHSTGSLGYTQSHRPDSDQRPALIMKIKHLNMH